MLDIMGTFKYLGTNEGDSSMPNERNQPKIMLQKIKAGLENSKTFSKTSNNLVISVVRYS